ncbi:hypothetical protein BN1195_03947 [Chryseobacterium oranimense G311]|uniref:STM3941 family protein n=1 Tax=Chryseobacterium oranimense TaxID=421058 RepID=UPI00053391C5|nr:STM3941 family protein [Chryseobacterium oranimense]CEJ71598.1 hypothetical protein BN1195_03947 [Chryseobacterium oranimense G311]
MNTIEIKSSKVKILLLILGSLGFVVLGTFFTVSPERFVSTIFRNSFFIRIAGILAMLFFGFSFFLLLKSFLTKDFNLIINEVGIINNSSYVSVGLIKWEDITSIEKATVMSTSFLLINVKSPQKYINACNGLGKKILKANFKTYGTPISISSSTLSYNFDELEKVITKFYNEYRNK